MEKQSENGILEDFRIEFVECWRRLPNKGFFFVLLAAWLALFQFLGNSTLGYVHSPSIFRWTLNAYHPTGDYFNSEDGHGVLIPFVVLALLWWKRKELLAKPLSLWTPGLAMVFLALFLHLVGYLIQQPRLSLIGFFAGIYGLMGLAWGLSWLRASFFPFFLFAFCIPLAALAQPITFGLRMFVCQLVEVISHYVLAIDVIRDGTSLRDPTGRYSYEVAAACSGIRSLTATVALALCFGFMSFRSWWKRGVLVAAAFPLAVLGNLMRMLSIVIAAEFGGQEAGEYVHNGGPGGIISLLPYVPPLLGMMLLTVWLEKPSAPAQPSAQPLEVST